MTEMARLGARQLEERAVALLKPHKRNPRKHSPSQLKQIEASIRKFGFLNPVLIDEANRTMAGHGRVAAARAMGLTTVPVLCIEGMSEAEKRAYIVADNRLAELAGWDEELLRLELGSILEFEPDFDLELTGFAGGELAALLEAVSEKPDAGETVPEPKLDEAPVSERGQLWALGRHRLICGDARDPSAYDRLLGRARPDGYHGPAL